MKVLLFILFFGFFLSSFGQEKNCFEVKKGTFFVKKNKNSAPIIIIKRSDSSQTETIVKTTNAIDYKLKWLNDCQFVMLPINLHNDAVQKTVVTIQKVRKYYYKIKATMLFQPVVYGKIYRK